MTLTSEQLDETASLAVRSAKVASNWPAWRASRSLPMWVYSNIAIVVVLTIWSLITLSGWIDPDYLPSPLDILRSFAELLSNGYKGISLYAHVGASLYRTVTGFVLGALIGIPLGLLTGYNRVAGALISPLMAFIRPIPPIAFIPMTVLYFGLGETGKIVLIFFTAFNYAQLNAHTGAAGVPIAYFRAAQSMGLNARQTFLSVVVPAALPQILTGLKVALALSWAVVVAAELVGAQRGLGFMISDAAQFFQIPVVFIGIGMIGAIGLLLNAVLGWVETRAVHWLGR